MTLDASSVAGATQTEHRSGRKLGELGEPIGPVTSEYVTHEAVFARLRRAFPEDLWLKRRLQEAWADVESENGKGMSKRDDMR